MTRILGLLFLLLALVFCVGVSPTQAEPVLDQSFDPGLPGPGSVTAGIGGGFDRAQTFTAGLGGLLTRVEVLLDRSAPNPGVLLFDVRPTRGGVPLEDETASLASLVVQGADLPGTRQFVSFDISLFGAIVMPGDVLAIVLRSPGQGVFTIFGRIGDPYGRGDAYFRSPDFRNWAPLGTTTNAIDFGFRTFVDPAIIPEPSGLVLLGTGILGLLGYTRYWMRAGH